jgi:hypothetical protein
MSAKEKLEVIQLIAKAHAVDVLIRKDGIELRYPADFLKEICRDAIVDCLFDKPLR